MQSLAALVTVLLLIILMLGPIALGLSFSKHPAALVVSVVIAALGVFAGVWLMLSVDAMGARVMGVISILISAAAAANVTRKLLKK